MRKSMVVMAVLGVLAAGCGSGDVGRRRRRSPPSPPRPLPRRRPPPSRSRRATRAPCASSTAAATRPSPPAGRRGRVPPAAAPGDRRDRRHDHADRHQHRRPAGDHGDRPRRPRRDSEPAACRESLCRRRLRLVSTGIAIHDSPLESARLRYARRAAKPVLGVEGGLVRTASRARSGSKSGPGARLPALRGARGRRPTRVALALEQVPAEAGGRWRLR